MIKLLKIPPHPERVAALACETVRFDKVWSHAVYETIGLFVSTTPA